MADQGLNFDNPLFKQFAFYSGVVIVKTMSMSVLTALNRIGKSVYANPEDCAIGKAMDRNCKPTLTDPTVERIRRCHLNDLENVIPFFLIGLLYVSSGPNPATALMYFRIFTGCRLLHTVAYLCKVPQPSRALLFGGGLVVSLCMAFDVIRKAC
ncbi:microsomal glutathione S-transferase 1-like [Mizuhopecten yessoensis]|uniref:Microsomal glutathione S-transferase 1 n=1 Tax=Mizuhopecten yessoensis TaxID=6573 RepID=A0A210QJJ5_MIZYE|nr:microsomal glutathione S-transferase 1-like [Mizuhopecten yessoensis]OWF48910.1 Microsomal glutathione S-transferase 1 [Mizuhopecten yessoensis]